MVAYAIAFGITTAAAVRPAMMSGRRPVLPDAVFHMSLKGRRLRAISASAIGENIGRRGWLKHWYFLQFAAVRLSLYNWLTLE